MAAEFRQRSTPIDGTTIQDYLDHVGHYTAEEKALHLQKTKRDLAAIISEDNSVICDLRREDLKMLLS